MNSTTRGLVLALAVLVVLALGLPALMVGMMGPGLEGQGPPGSGMMRGQWWVWGLGMGLGGLVMLLFWGALIVGLVLLARALRGALESALARPAATFGGEDLYSDIADKAAALMHSLALNYPFVDGNKRVAAFAAIVFAASNGHEFRATPDELVETTLAVTEGKMAVEALAIWFRQRLRSVE